MENKKSVICFKEARHSFSSILVFFARSTQNKKYFCQIFETIHFTLSKSTKDFPYNKSIAFKTSLSDIHGTCFEENLPYPLFQHLSHSETPMRWHANASALTLGQLLTTAIWSPIEQRLNACQSSNFSAICQQTQSL